MYNVQCVHLKMHYVHYAEFPMVIPSTYIQCTVFSIDISTAYINV